MEREMTMTKQTMERVLTAMREAFQNVSGGYAKGYCAACSSALKVLDEVETYAKQLQHQPNTCST
jgi:hypothetical protein